MFSGGDNNYGKKEYWDERYKESEKKTKSESEETGIRHPDEGSLSKYEWYLLYDEFKEFLLPELVQNGSFELAKVLVTGCGNSTLCEDLSESGGKMW